MAETTGLSAGQKKRIRENLRKRIKTKFYRKGHAAEKTGKKVSDIKTKKGVQKDLGAQREAGTISQKVHDTRVAKRAYRKKHKESMKSKGHVSKMSKQAAKTGRKVASAKAEGKTPVHTVKKSLKGKFTSKSHATKWGKAKTKQLNALKKAGKITKSEHAAKIGKTQRRTTRGKTKTYS